MLIRQNNLLANRNWQRSSELHERVRCVELTALWTNFLAGNFISRESASAALRRCWHGEVRR